MRDIQDYCEAQRSWLLETIRALVSCESPTDDKAAVDRCGRELQRRLEQIGGGVTRIPSTVAGDHLRAVFPSTSLRAGPSTSLGASPSISLRAGGSGERQILLLGHFDTVWDVGQLDAMPLREDNDRLYGPGVYDMKAGIALAMLAARVLFERGPAPPCRLVMLWTTDEETGSDTSRPLIEDEARRSAAVLVLEPSLPGGAVKTARKGCGDFELIVRGVAAHAGIDPSKGASAIRELARQILRLESLQDPERGVTINVGVVSGGMRPNVVPDHARALIDVRVRSMTDAARVDAALRRLSPELPGTSLEIHGAIDRPPFERSAAVVELYELARGVSAELGRALGEGATGGGSDGNFTAALGIPTLDGLGAVGDGAHARHEHVVIPELPWRAALLAGVISRLAQDG